MCLRPRFCRFGILFVWLVIGNLFIIFIYMNIPNNYYNRPSNINPRKKYITVTIEKKEKCGNFETMVMWRIASLNELSIYLNRIMYVDRKDKCLLQQREEFKEIFKNTQNYFKIKNPSRDSTAIVAFAEHCCRFDNPDRLMSTHATLLKITGKLLQSHKYLSLNKAKDRVRSLFEFNKSVIERTNNYTKKLFRNDSSHKLCVHMERENLLEMGQSTGLYLTEQLIAFIYKTLKKRTKNISIVLIGRDTNFLNMVRGVEGLPIYISAIRNRGVELNFAISNCNSLLITASTSKEAWWIGYLMPDGSPIYYNNCLGIDCKSLFKKDYFPPEWLPLTTDYQGNIILDDNPFE